MPNLKHLGPNKIILIGASTGGPGHIKKILSALEPNFNASIVIAQHMGHDYLPSFVKQLNSICLHQVHLLCANTSLLPSQIYVASLLTTIKVEADKLICLQKQPQASAYNPDIDCLFTSASLISAKVPVMGVILTGIGSDGALGCQKLSEMGGDCIAECKTSAIVDGMPMQTRNLVKNIKILPLEQIIKQINVFGCR